MTIYICGADEIEALIAEKNVNNVLSLEHPGAEDGRGRAPRLGEDINQKILCFWDVEEEGGEDQPSEELVSDALDFLDDHQEEDIAVHCKAGKSRSVAIVMAWLANRDGVEHIAETITTMRPQAAPNSAIIDIADRLYGMDGTLNAALLSDEGFTERREAANIRRDQQRNDPEFRKANPEKVGTQEKFSGDDGFDHHEL